MFVMAGLVPAIHDFMQQAKTWMHKAGHDEDVGRS
jgi:hypothetical protein